MEPLKNSPPSKKPRVKSSNSTLLHFTDIVFRMALMKALGVWLGKWLDAKFGFVQPVCLLILSLSAVFGGIYMVIKAADKSNK